MDAADFGKYYVDGDNCPGVRTAGIEVLQEEEEVIVFYAASNTHYGSEKVREKLRGKTKAHLSFEAVPAGKNAVDFAIAARVGADLQAGRRRMFLVSGDKDFETIVKVLGKEPAPGKCIRHVETVREGILSDGERIRSLSGAADFFRLQFGTEEGEQVFRVLRRMFFREFLARRLRRRRRRGSAGRRGRFGKSGGAGKQGRQGNSENEQMYKKLYLTFIPKLIILSV